MEIRSFSENAAPKLLDGRIIEGYAVVFERESRIMFDREKKRYFIEKISRNSVTEADLNGWDIKALIDHQKGRLLARSFNGKGTLSLSVDEYGVKYRFEAPETNDGNYAVEMIRRGDIFGSSFAYVTDEKESVKYTKRSDGLLLRDVNKLHRMFDVSVVTDPAYFGTDVAVRSLDDFFDDNDDSWKKDLEETRSLIK